MRRYGQLLLCTHPSIHIYYAIALFADLTCASVQTHASIDASKAWLWWTTLVLSHVCRRWRELALTSPNLWSFIRITGTPINRVMVHEYLQRSGSCSALSFLFTFPRRLVNSLEAHHESPGLYAIIEAGHTVQRNPEVLERIESLGIVLSDQNIIKFTYDAATRPHPPPRLRTLWLEAYQPNGTMIPIQRRLDPPVAWARAGMEHLRILHVRYLPPPVLWVPQQGLVKLDLSCFACDHPMSIPEILQVLRQSPQLEELKMCLQSEAPAHSSDNVYRAEPVALNGLQKLSLRTRPGYDSAFNILPYVSFPATTAVHIGFLGPQYGQTLMKTQRLDTLVRGSSKVRFVVDSMLQGTLTYGHNLFSMQYNLAPIRPSIGAGATPLSSGFLIVRHLQQVTCLDLSLCASGSAGARVLVCPVSEWLETFGCFPNVVELRLKMHPSQSRGVFGALQPLPHEASEIGVCRSLSRLSVAWSRWVPAVLPFLDIETCCRVRAERGARLDHLEVAGLPRAVSMALQGCVGKIVTLPMEQRN